jgi:hypothetical protein
LDQQLQDKHRNRHGGEPQRQQQPRRPHTSQPTGGNYNGGLPFGGGGGGGGDPMRGPDGRILTNLRSNRQNDARPPGTAMSSRDDYRQQLEDQIR